MKELESFVPEARAELLAEKEKLLTAGEKEVLDLLKVKDEKPKLTADQHLLKESAERKINISALDLFNAIQPKLAKSNQGKLKEVYDELVSATEQAYWIDRYREIANFNYWRTRARAEQTENALAARRFMHEGRVKGNNAELEEARDDYELGMDHWRLVLAEYPLLLEDHLTTEDLMDIVARYKYRVLRQLVRGEPSLPKGYSLISINDISDFKAFAKLLVDTKDSAEKSPAKRLWDGIDKQEQKLMERWVSGKSITKTETSNILYALNEQIKNAELYDPEYFPEIMLSSEEQHLLNCYRDPDLATERRGLTLRDLRLLNRSIIQRSFPDLIKPSVDEFILEEVFRKHPMQVRVRLFLQEREALAKKKAENKETQEQQENEFNGKDQESVAPPAPEKSTTEE